MSCLKWEHQFTSFELGKYNRPYKVLRDMFFIIAVIHYITSSGWKRLRNNKRRNCSHSLLSLKATEPNAKEEARSMRYILTNQLENFLLRHYKRHVSQPRFLDFPKRSRTSGNAMRATKNMREKNLTSHRVSLFPSPFFLEEGKNWPNR